MQIYDYTVPELQRYRELCNFIDDEMEYFNLRSRGKSNIQIAIEVIEYAGDKNIGLDHNSRWICMCDCGNTTMVGSWKLKSGHTKSCGCLASEKARKRMLERNPMKERNDKNE